MNMYQDYTIDLLPTSYSLISSYHSLEFNLKWKQDNMTIINVR